MRFAYLRDPLFLGCLAVYFVNRWVCKALFAGTFWHAYLNDLICIPFWAPIMLFGMRKLRLRDHDGPPEAHEILIPLLVWSVVFEVWLPQTAAFRGLSVADPFDILCYTLGALAAGVVWRVWYCEPKCSDSVAVSAGAGAESRGQA